MFDKRQIARQFDRSAAQYENFDSLQRLMNDELLEWVTHCQHMADIGCGNGRALARIAKKQPQSQRIAVDISAGMLRRAQQSDPETICLQADMEQLPLASHAFDLVYSCAAMQWSQPQQVLQEMHRILRPQGQLLIGTLVAGSLKEWHQAWEMAGNNSRVHSLPEPSTILNRLTDMGFTVGRNQQIERCFHYDCPETMLQDLKGLGGTHASLSRPKGLLGKNTYRRFREALLGLGCVARYQVLLVEARLP